MISATTWKYNNAVIPVDEALRIRDVNNGVPRGTFTCIECGQAVRAHKAGDDTNHPAHFEHFERNPVCPYSASESTVNRINSAYEPETYELDDPRATEGYEKDSQIISKSRNPKISNQRKVFDNYTCQACDLRLEINGRFIIECHHLNPVSMAGVTEIGLDDLVSLCPMCHRIAHTRNEPFSIMEIRCLLVLEDA